MFKFKKKKLIIEDLLMEYKYFALSLLLICHLEWVVRLSGHRGSPFLGLDKALLILKNFLYSLCTHILHCVSISFPLRSFPFQDFALPKLIIPRFVLCQRTSWSSDETGMVTSGALTAWLPPRSTFSRAGDKRQVFLADFSSWVTQ